jgi:hypothetical protein
VAGGITECRYDDIAQCRASVSGVGGYCYQNLDYVELAAPQRHPRVKRRHHD